jgi:hypothetical protein
VPRWAWFALYGRVQVADDGALNAVLPPDSFFHVFSYTTFALTPFRLAHNRETSIMIGNNVRWAINLAYIHWYRPSD